MKSLAAMLLVPAVLVAQAQPGQTNSTQTPMGRAMMSERNGAWADAAAQYQAILATQPANIGALIGLEHVMPKLDRRADLLVALRTALAADSANTGILGIFVRTWATLGQSDSARVYVARWVAHSPNDGDPYREWADAALQVRDLPQARLALDVGREKMGPKALGIERAQLLQSAGDYAGAVHEWIPVVHETPPFREGAVTMLVRVPLAGRALVRDALVKDGSRDAKQMLGLLQVQWGESAAGTAVVLAAIPTDSLAATGLLQELYDVLRVRDDRASHLAAGATLEAMGQRESGATAVRTLMDGARAYADGGDERNARRLLGVVSANPAAPGGMASAASATLLGVLIAEGKAAEAERVLGQLGDKLDLDEHDRLARRIAMAWVRTGDFARADLLVAADSSVAGFDLRGRLRLFRGDLAGANDLLKVAGPYDDEREQALERVTLLSLIQAIGKDSLPALGTALLTLERGDTTTAIAGLAAIAATLGGGGAAETRLLTGRVALAHRDTTAALGFLKAADLREFPATAAAARLDIARIALGRGGAVEARAVLEQLIIDFPESALVPEARHLRDTIRGAIPAGNR